MGDVMVEEKTVALALGGGGSLGMAHLGVLKVFEKNNIPITSICGSSIGAIVGAHYALYKDLDKLEEDAMSFISENKFSLFNVETILERKTMIKKIELFFEDIFENKTFSDCKIPFACNALDLETGNTIYLDKGDIKKAVLASMSIPGVFDPVFYWGDWYVDGGFLDPVPLGYFDNKTFDLTVGIDLHPEGFKPFDDSPSYSKVLQRVYSIFQHHHTHNILDKHPNAQIIKPEYDTTKDLFSVSTAKSYMLAGEKGALKSIDIIKAKLNIKD